MSLKDKPAFPIECWVGQDRDGEMTGPIGMTFREYFAGLAMQGLSQACRLPHVVAKDAVVYADALIAELERSESE